MKWQGVIDTYRKHLPIPKDFPAVTLLEGNTPLIPVPKIAKMIADNIRLFVKYEGLNPTGSFKDRGMTMAITKVLEEGYSYVMCASTGNTSASAAAYSARAGIKCAVVIPEGSIALGKLAQACVHGAKVLAVKGNFDDALRIVREITDKYPIQLVNSINPYRIEGQKTAAFEICDVLGRVPDYHAIPVGNAGNITAYWEGYKEYNDLGITKTRPVMLGFQAEDSAPIVRGYPIKEPKTIATAIKIGNPASWKQAEAARDESGGLIDFVSDKEILEAYNMLASLEGVFVEPASAASIAGLLKITSNGYFQKDLNKDEVWITATVTGHGLKDPDRAIAESKPPVILDASIDAVAKELEL